VKTLLAARLLVSLPLGRVASFFPPQRGLHATIAPQFRTDCATFSLHTLPIIRHKTGEARMPKPSAPTPAKDAKPGKDTPAPVRFDDWASI
jgi:hypothetical protein